MAAVSGKRKKKTMYLQETDGHQYEAIRADASGKDFV